LSGTATPCTRRSWWTSCSASALARSDAADNFTIAKALLWTVGYNLAVVWTLGWHGRARMQMLCWSRYLPHSKCL
jgi:hypothetical protein